MHLRSRNHTIYRAIEFAPIWIVLTFGRILPFWVRAKMFGIFGRHNCIHISQKQEKEFIKD